MGSICSGGRYDKLTERFHSRELPGVGGSIGLDRLLNLSDQLLVVDDLSKRTVFVAILNDKVRSYAFTLATRLRAAGICCDLSVKPQKIANQFKHAHRMSYPLVLVLGEEELSKNEFNLKDMSRVNKKNTR